MAPADVHSKIPTPLFKIGALVFTKEVNRLIGEGRLDPWPFFQRHARGDWGDVSDAIRRVNDGALGCDHLPLHSRYEVAPDITLCIVTTEKRDTTVACLSDEHDDN